MIIYKHLEKKVKLDYFFIQGKIEVNADSLIEKIKKGCEAEDNLTNVTNIKDKMTSWKYFYNDNEFLNILHKMIDYVDSNIHMPAYNLADAWGFSCSNGAKTLKHNHRGNEWSGVLYLNDHEQTLDFDLINEKVKPEKGGFAIFSSFLDHEAKVHRTTNTKFGISFNLRENGFHTR